jgi:CheY-like chemotaxis protein
MLNLILSIDDDRVTQMLNQMIFSRTTFAKKCLPFMNGDEAVTYFNQLTEMAGTPDNTPAVIFLDLNMPIIGGWEFMAKMEEKFTHQFPDIKVVILSSSIDPEEKKQAKENPTVIAFLNKPLTLDMINELKQHPDLKKNFSEL